MECIVTCLIHFTMGLYLIQINGMEWNGIANKTHQVVTIVKSCFYVYYNAGNCDIAKTTVLGMIEDDRPHGRPTRRWSDDTADWCSCALPEAVQLALNM